MLEYSFGTVGPWQFAVLAFCAVLIGINKTGLPGLGTLPVILLSLAFDPGISPGIQLFLLCAADVTAVIYYRRHAEWKIIFRVIPFALAGLGVGHLVLCYFPSRHLPRLIGGIIIALTALNYFKEKALKHVEAGGTPMAAAFGVLMGCTTQIANAAGPVSTIYLLLMKLEKHRFMGVTSYLFLLLNWIKLPIFIGEGRVTAESVMLDCWVLPFVLLGGVLGIVFLNKIPQKKFELLLQLLILVSAAILCFK